MQTVIYNGNKKKPKNLKRTFRSVEHYSHAIGWLNALYRPRRASCGALTCQLSVKAQKNNTAKCQSHSDQQPRSNDQISATRTYRIHFWDTKPPYARREPTPVARCDVLSVQKNTINLIRTFRQSELRLNALGWCDALHRPTRTSRGGATVQDMMYIPLNKPRPN
jgi:hypothetical protein